jgi:tetratricopeptide (TPR) repeat protein
VNRLAIRLALLGLLAALPRPAAWAQRPASPAEQWIAAARRAIERGEHDRAGALLDRALAFAGVAAGAELYLLRAAVFGKRGAHDRAVALLERARTRFPDDPEIALSLGAQLMLARRSRDGERVLRELVARAPQRWEAHLVLARHYLGRRAFSAAAAAYHRYFTHRPVARAPGDRAHRSDLARALFGARQPAQAARLYDTLLRASPGDEQLWIGLFWARAASDCRQARAMFPRARGLEARYPSIAVVRARCEMALNRTARAAAVAEAHRHRHPADAHGWALHGDLQLARGEPGAARLAYGRALELAPGSAWFRWKLARASREAGDAARVVDLLAGRHPPAHLALRWTEELAEALHVQGRTGELRALLAARPTETGAAPRLSTLLGLVLLGEGEIAAAAAALERGVGRDERALEPLLQALEQLAHGAVQRGDTAAAVEHLQRALRWSDRPALLRNLAVVQLARGQADVRLLERAVERAPADPVAWLLLSRAQAQAGAADRSWSALERARALARGPAAVEVAIEIAVLAARRGRAEEVLGSVDPVLAAASAGDRRARAAWVAVTRAAARSALRAGRFARAQRMLARLVEQLGASAGGEWPALGCELAVAASAAGQHETAIQLLERDAATDHGCDLGPAPGGRGGALLLTWNLARRRGQAERALVRFRGLRGGITGASRALVDRLGRDVALLAAREAYEAGALRRAASHLDTAAAWGATDGELRFNRAVLALGTSRRGAAMRTFRELESEVPEALVALAVAHEQQDEPERVLEFLRRAAARGVDYPPLAAWLKVKERMWGGAP